MARIAQENAFAEARDYAVELRRKAPLRENEFQLSHRSKRLADGIAISPQPVRKFAQDAVNFARFFLEQPH